MNHEELKQAGWLPPDEAKSLTEKLAQAQAGLHAFRSFVCITPSNPLNTWFEERDKLLNNDFGMGKGWLSPDEAASAQIVHLMAQIGKERDVLRAELNRWQNAFAMFKGTPEELAQWAVRDANEAKRLEADAACLREALQDWKRYYKAEIDKCDRDIQACQSMNDSYGVNFHQGRRSGIIQHDIGLQKFKDALNNATAGRSLLERLERYETVLHQISDHETNEVANWARELARESLKGDK